MYNTRKSTSKGAGNHDKKSEYPGGIVQGKQGGNEGRIVFMGSFKETKKETMRNSARGL